jgi:hypothetical protein
MKFESPSRVASIELWQPAHLNGNEAGIDLVKGGKAIRLFTAKQEGLVYFMHVYWSPDESKVGVVGTGTVIFHLAYDLTNGRAIPFELIRKELAASIAESYSLPSDEADPIQWAAHHHAMLQFRKKYPEFHTTYTR